MGLTLVVGGGSSWLALAWAEDDQAAGAIADRMVANREAGPREENLALAPSTFAWKSGWWTNSAEGSWLRAWAIDRPLADDAPVRMERIRSWLDSARATSPTSPTVRHALVRRAGPQERDRAETWPIGMSHDVLTRALAGRRLLAEGKVEAARMAYREALEMACHAPVAAVVPTFDEKGTRRYRLPNEDLLAAVVAELVGRPDWDLPRWKETLPRHALAALAVARAMKERTPLDADRMLSFIVEESDVPSVRGAAQAWHLAAKAEALAMLDRNEAALAVYREAIAAAPEGASRRVLRYNLADVASRLGDVTMAREALAAAHAGSFDDEIGRNVLRSLAELDRGGRGPGLGVASYR
jgi:hypothetical protein